MADKKSMAFFENFTDNGVILKFKISPKKLILAKYVTK